MPCIAFVCAVASMFAVPPDAAYIEYFDIRVLCQLFCLMAVVAGLQSCGLLQFIADRLLRCCYSLLGLELCLVMLPFFFSMLVTNDVALLAFVPFAFLVLKAAGAERLIIKTAVLQTAAANLGGMLTPFGNPQNLYIYSHFGLGIEQFIALMLPLTGISFILIFLLCIKSKSLPISCKPPFEGRLQKGKLLLYAVLFIICVLCVLRIIPYQLMLLLVTATILIWGRRPLMKVDYGLLLTFVCFFILSGNLSRLPAIHNMLVQLMEQSSLLCSCFASQFISNVPAAVLLSDMTADWQGLLAGVNIGGLGTPIASLASLITLKFFMKEYHCKTGRFLLFFSAVNFGGLLLLLAFARLFLL